MPSCCTLSTPSGVCATMPCSSALARRGGWPTSSGSNALKLVAVKGICVVPMRSACWPVASRRSASGKGSGVVSVRASAAQPRPWPEASSPGLSMERRGMESRAAKGQPLRSGVSWRMVQPWARCLIAQSLKPSAKAPVLQRQSRLWPATSAASRTSTPNRKRPSKGARGGLDGLAFMLRADIAGIESARHDNRYRLSPRPGWGFLRLCLWIADLAARL